jgi:hypothetical protein
VKTRNLDEVYPIAPLYRFYTDSYYQQVPY